ncbi:DeoR/GlpR family DNA-binding transcription regulator [Neobacillus mesonae]|uniref:DeoR family transcriptional regulator n=1 Tax=Neobacillus mesonae TaxID=1193713 RepID=A0A3T0HST6_9BACI|nr:DeoR/GlpR family DNA-binding transcription regulator [Neobacillus mesonae]AZU60179.1 DeoR family transcriptional regulator [Neobacillus mesonae]
MSLLAEERKRKIIELIEKYGQVKVADLAEDFQVSTESIRRYLEELEHERKLKKVYGGAVKVSDDIEEPTLFDREILHIDEKRKISKKALTFIEHNDVIMIDEGSTTLQMIDGLKEFKGLTVITNSFPAASKLISFANKNLFDGEIIFLGGNIRHRHYRTSGSLAERMAAEFYADKAFISIDGLELEAGMTSYDLEKSILTQNFIKNSKNSIVLTDRTKIGVKANYRITSVQEIDYIITDFELDAKSKEYKGISEKWVVC